MLTRPGLSRRQLLAAAQSALLYYPLVRALGPSELSAQAANRHRVIFVSFPSGTYRNRFWPQGDAGPLGALPIVTSPLEIHKQDMTLYRGFNLVGATNHNGSMPQVLAGWGACSRTSPVRCGKNPNFPNNDNTTTQNMEAVPYSLDQRLADRIGTTSVRSSINMGIQCGIRANPFPEPVSWTKTGEPNFPNDNPKSTFDDLFGKFTVPTGGSSSQGAADGLVAKGKKRIIDYLVGDLKRIKSSLGAHEAAAFESHVAALDDINRDLNATINNTPVAVGAQCNPKTIETLFPGSLADSGGQPWYFNSVNSAAIYRLQRTIMVQAMACDLTRVGVWQMGCSHQESHIPAEGVVDSPARDQVLHLLAHSDSEFYANNQQGQMREVAKMVTDLKNTAAGDKTLFDETLVYVATDIGDNAAAHGGNNIAAYMLGSLGGKVKTTGQMVTANGLPYNHLLVTVAQLMGLTDMQTIGNTAAVGPVRSVIG